jgi:hypothetical protein
MTAFLKCIRVVLWLTFVSLCMAGAETSAFAYYPFPGYVEAHLDVTTLPADPAGQYCELCHNNPAGGLGTATQPFGLLIKAQGILYTSSEAQLDAALDAIKENPATTNYITDIEMGVNPNTDPSLQGGAASSDVLMPAYGCGATIAPGALPHSSGLVAMVFTYVLGIALGVRRAKPPARVALASSRRRGTPLRVRGTRRGSRCSG